MDTPLPDPLPYQAETTPGPATTNRNGGNKRKRDSVDGELSERSTQRLNSTQYNIPDTEQFRTADFSGPQPQDEPGFFDLGTSSQSRDAKTIEAQMADPPRTAQYGDSQYPPLPGPHGLDALASHAIASDKEASIAQGDNEGPDPNHAQHKDDSLSDPSYMPWPASTPHSNRRPNVGTEEWHAQRKNNHKEVERRRRETINEGINAIACLLPEGARNEKNKGAILNQAAKRIRELQLQFDASIDKWTREKLVVDHALKELEQRLERMYNAAEAWKRVAKEAGVDVDSVDIRMEPLPAGAVGEKVISEVRARYERGNGEGEMGVVSKIGGPAGQGSMNAFDEKVMDGLGAVAGDAAGLPEP